MVRLLTDNDFNGHIIRGLLRRRPEFDLVRVQDIGLTAATDPEILAWAAQADRIVATRDHNTMIGFALSRVAANEPMPGLFVVDHGAPVIRSIDTLLLTDEASEHADWANRIEFMPW